MKKTTFRTWFRNKIDDMPQEHLDKLIKKHIRGIMKSYIYGVSFTQYRKDCDELMKCLEEDYEDKDKNDDFYKFEKEFLEKESTREYYEKSHNKYVKDLEILKNPNSTKKELIKVFARHDLSFSRDSYLLQGLGWYNNYRIIGDEFTSVVHHNAEEAIKWLEEYDNGENIICNNKKGMSDEIREIIRDFFKQYPNGTIHYG